MMKVQKMKIKKKKKKNKYISSFSYINYLIWIKLLIINKYNILLYILDIILNFGDWGLGIGDWGLGIGEIGRAHV